MKREIVTRVHTAAITNTVTEVYSTTTKVVVAPTVEIIISGDITLTSTLPLADGSLPTGEPSFTITSTWQDRGAVVAAPTDQPATPGQTVEDDQEGNNVVIETNQQHGTTTIVAAVPTAAFNDHTGVHTDEGSSNVSPTSASNQSSTSASNESSTSANNDSSSSASNNDSTNNDNADSNGSSSDNDSSNSTDNNSSSSNGSSDNSNNSGSSNNDNSSTSESNSSPSTGNANEAKPDATTTSTEASTATASTAASTTASADSSTGSLKGVPTAIVYSPYNDDSTCKDASTVSSDLQLIKSKGISKIRIYGTDCNSLQTIQPAAAQLGLKVNQGLWIDGSGVDSIDGSLSDIISYAQANSWDIFDFITIGNEAIISGYCSVSDLIQKISSVKAQLRSAGYNGQVTTSEPPVIYQNNPELCKTSEIDFVGINSHPYFDVNSSAGSSGTFVKSQLEIVKQVCGTNNVLVTETGYPSSGNQNGGNFPSKDNQQIAIAAILSELNQEATILSTFNDYWKNPGPYGIEQSFGIIDLLP